MFLTLLILDIANAQGKLHKYKYFEGGEMYVNDENGIRTVFMLINGALTGPFLKYKIRGFKILKNGFYFNNELISVNKWSYNKDDNLVEIIRTSLDLNAYPLNKYIVRSVFKEGQFLRNSYRFISYQPFYYQSQFFIWGEYPNTSNDLNCYDDIINPKYVFDKNNSTNIGLRLSKSNSRNFQLQLSNGDGKEYFIGFIYFTLVMLYDVEKIHNEVDRFEITFNDLKYRSNVQYIPLMGIYVERLTPLMHYANDVSNRLIW